MDHYSRYSTIFPLLLHENDDSLWFAELTEPILSKSLNVDDLTNSSNLVLRECNQNFARHCGYDSTLVMVGQTINRYVFTEEVSEVTIVNDSNARPFILKFQTLHESHDTMDKGYMNTIGLVTDDRMIYAMLGRQYDITPQLRKKAERKAVVEKLTGREYDIFLSLAKGETVKHIAGRHGSTEKAIYYHIENMERKMKTQSIIGIIEKAYRLGFMDTGNT